MATGVVRGLIGALSKASAASAALILVGMAVYVLIEIAMRAFLGSGTNVLVEFIGYGLAGLTFLSASTTMREGGLVRVSVFLERCGPSVRRALDTLCLVTTIVVITVFGWYVSIDMWRSFDRDYETDSLYPLPMWLPPLPLMLGVVIFLLDMLLHLVLVVRGQALLAEHSPDVL